MGIFELVFIAFGLSMDAFAVSICKGLSCKKISWRHYIITGIWFGGFQALMPLLGYFLGSSFNKYIIAFDHWVAFALLGVIGLNMIKESLNKQANKTNCSFSAKIMLVMSIATSIDALAVGITFALISDISIFIVITCIGLITFILSVIGLKIGNIFGARCKSSAEFIGGAILILIGIKILLEHIGVIK